MTTAATPPRRVQVTCPACGEATWFAPDNPYRPFCSARCQGLDFGAWASEHYRVGAAPASGAADAAGAPDALDARQSGA